ncbi:MAG TPA: transcriptional repressor LexA [Bacteriovoracaceae bacterium]|nr:transcriptional repressor LexA [Bacteriovoracaceae bacterium]
MALTKKQKEVLVYITEYVRAQGYSPTQKEIQEYFSFKSLGSVQDYIKYLTNGGYLVNDSHSVRGLMPATVQQNTEEIPLLGSVAAGVPIEAIENTDMISVPVHMLGRGSHYALKIKGESMIEEGILNGDIAIIKHQTLAENGQIVVAVVDNETTLKKYFKKAKQVELHPANKTMKPIILKDKECEIRGLLVGLIRTY